MEVFILVLNLFVCFNMLIMAGLLWFRKENTRSNMLLGMFLFYSVLTLINNVLIYTNTIYFVYPLIYINVGFQLLTGPTLLLYFMTLMGIKFTFHWKHSLHFVPALLVMGFGIQQGFLPQAQKVADVRAMQQGTSDTINFFNQLIFFHALIYFTSSWFIIKKYRRETKLFFAHPEQTKIGWIKQFLLLLITINVLCILGYGLQAIYLPSYYVYTDMIFLPSLCFPFYLFILIQAFNNHTIFTRSEYQVYQQQLEPLHAFIEEQQEKKNVSLSLPEALLDSITQGLQHLFREKEFYTDKELSLQKLAAALSVTSHQLSYYINQKHAQNFSDFINSYRVEKAKTLLTDAAYNNYSVEGIGQECGFNTRTTFYAAFRKHAGTTPVGYRKEYFSAVRI